MADEEQVKRLLAGVEGWNLWRKENRGVPVNLIGAELCRTDLSGANLEAVHLVGANLVGAKLISAKLAFAHLARTNLRGAILTDADLHEADLKDTNLTEADLGRARLDARLVGVKLDGAKLYSAYLASANLVGASLVEADFREAFCNGMTLTNLDLHQAKNLETIRHGGPSHISTSTLERSRGRLPEAFLKGCGLQDWEILAAKLYDPDLTTSEVTDLTYEITHLRTDRPILINPLFISYSHKDKAFVEAIKERLNAKGIRYWLDYEHATAGRLEKIIDQAMTLNPTVLLVLSENSVESDWVEWEARKARKLEKKLKRDVLCPVRLDESCFECDWPERLREQIFEYNVLDFSRWEEPKEVDEMFERLLKGLGVFYMPEPAKRHGTDLDRIEPKP